MKKLVIICCFLSCYLTAGAQTDAALAQQYMSTGQYDKAADLYKNLFNDNPNGYYKAYYNCLLVLQDYKEVEKIIDKQIKKNPDNLTYYVDYGIVLEKQGDKKNATKQYESAIQKMTDSRPQVTQLANAFIGYDMPENAIRVYERARDIVSTYSFNYELAGLYYRAGSFDQALDTYLDYYVEDPMGGSAKVTSAFSRILDEEKDHTLLQEKLFARIQNGKYELQYTELLIWDYIQQKDFDGALIQAKALDKRNKENGERVYDLGETARAEESYDAAITAFEYIISKGKDSPYYFSAKNGILNCHKDKIFKLGQYTKSDIDALRNSYTAFLAEYDRKDARAASVTDDLAKLEAFYAADFAKAISLAEPLVDWPAISAADRSRIKLDLGDFYLISGDVWEATLLYAQVDKAMKDEPLGEEARFKSAKLAYYRGDFSFAQGMLDVLKAATSELISNDAMQLSVFITDNLGLDSIAEPMMLYAKADLLLFQNNIQGALKVLDTLTTTYPAHQLSDDVLFLKAKIAIKQQDYTTAVNYLEQIRQNYAYELLGDDAIYMLGDIYQYQFKDNEKAQLCYEQIFMNFKDSLYSTEARKRYRQLRGDKIN
ncbi:MAG TPA: tetratricopeptide repeat protein [Chitinophagales bacterium]|nr:tetratricopeptide repeat protein [Chitinophagales bacterium]HNJ90566.1 tetratricopeptide repeat protein [Chitinophagales bacterium]